MARKSVTIRDVAAASGFSIYTVSCVLNNKGSISQATREKVQKTIRELGYDPLKNMTLAENLSAKTIGLALPSIYCEGHPFFFRAISVTRQFASRHDWDVKLFTESDLKARLNSHLNRSTSLGFHGLIVFCCNPPASCIQPLLSRSMPVALVRRHMDIKGLIEITDDDSHGITLAMRHLHQVHGHRRIALLAARFHEGTPADRLAGYLNYAKQHKLPCDEDMRLERNSLGDNLGRRLTSMYEQGRMTALVCFEDRLAVEAAKALMKNGIRIPQDVALIGYNNDLTCELFHPEISSINVPVEEMVAAACHAIIGHDPNVTATTTAMTFENALVARESCGPHEVA